MITSPTRIMKYYKILHVQSQLTIELFQHTEDRQGDIGGICSYHRARGNRVWKNHLMVAAMNQNSRSLLTHHYRPRD